MQNNNKEVRKYTKEVVAKNLLNYDSIPLTGVAVVLFGNKGNVARTKIQRRASGTTSITDEEADKIIKYYRKVADGVYNHLDKLE
jgi:hypothetical protein